LKSIFHTARIVAGQRSGIWYNLRAAKILWSLNRRDDGGVFDHFKADIGRYKRYGTRYSTLRLLMFTQGLWAVCCYRVGHHLNTHRLPPVLRHIVMFFYHFWYKGIQIWTGICISPDCRIGPGLYIGHFGQIFVHMDVEIGNDCNISQGVTLGQGRVRGRWGTPKIGNRVYIAPGAKVFGPIVLADGTVVGANAVVNRDTEENAVVAGVPAKVISHEGSGEYMV
jgi:serine O-acetyltransferase